MKEYFWILGSLCVLYYLILVIYSRRLRSTFAVFWLLTGGAHLFFGCVPLPAYVESVFGWICLGLWILFLTVEIKICLGMFSKPERGAQWIIILGAQVRGRKITDSLKRRLDAAIHYLEENERTMVVVSGGRGREKIFQKRMQWNNILSNKELRKIGSERKISPFLQEKI